MEAKVYNQNGEEIEILTLPEKIFGCSWNPNLVRQVYLSERTNKRKNIASTKDRSEVSGGGKKPWQQKGTGRARHGSIRSPIWIGGGVTHGPRNERSYYEKINKKARRRALLTVLSQKLRENEILFLDGLNIAEAKTKEAKVILDRLPMDHLATKLFVFPERDEKAFKALRNISNVRIIEARNLNTSQLLNHKYVIFSGNSEKKLEETFLN